MLTQGFWLIASRLQLSALAAVILALAFSSYNLGMLSWAGLLPLFFAIDNKTPKQAFVITYTCGLFFFLLSMYWLIYITATGWLLLSLYQALYFGIFGALCVHLLSTASYQLSAYLSIPSIWCVLEYLRSHLGGGIGWNLLGYSQYQNIPIIQIADITGAYGISFLIVLVNVSLFVSIKMAVQCQKANRTLFVKSRLPFKEELKSHPIFQTLSAFFILLFVLGYGYRKIDTLDSAVGQGLKIAIVQGNIPQTQKWNEVYKDFIIKKYEALTAKASGDSPHIIIWPETSVPGYLNEDRQLLQRIQYIARRAGSFLLAGAPMVAEAGLAGIADYNSAILFSKDGELLQQHNKLHLVAFGEFIPFERYLPFLRDILPLTGYFISGTEYTLFILSDIGCQPSLKFGVLICFEDIFPDIVRRFVKKGADFMVNITNDAWFGKSSAAYQHTANSVFRAVENRRPFVRCANTGLSCFINILGEIYDRVWIDENPLFIDGYITQHIGIGSSMCRTFYTVRGDVFILFLFFLSILTLTSKVKSNRMSKR